MGGRAGRTSGAQVKDIKVLNFNEREERKREVSYGDSSQKCALNLTRIVLDRGLFFTAPNTHVETRETQSAPFVRCAMLCTLGSLSTNALQLGGGRPT